MKGRALTGLADQAEALSSYVDTLLTEVDSGNPAGDQQAAVKPQPEQSRAKAALGLEAACPSLQRGEPTVESLPAVQIKVTDEIADTGLEQARKPEPQASAAPVPAACQRAGQGRIAPQAAFPAWAESPFQVLMFRLNGLSLGVPLCSLVSIVRWDGEICRLPGQPAWHQGVVINQGRRVSVVDTALLLMPERLAQHSGRGLQAGSYLLLVGDGSLGLAVDGIGSTQMLKRDAVHWRSHSSRPWLAGTMIEQLSILLDVEGLLGMIA